MAEAALALDNRWENQSSVSDQLRQQKAEQAFKQANAQRLQSQAIGVNSGINERLMSRQNQAKSDEATEPEQSVTNDQINTDTDQADSNNQADSLKQAQQLARLAANPTPAGLANAAAEQVTAAIKSGAGAKLLTGPLLSASWKTLIESCGATLIYLNIHAWAGFIEGHKVFCKLGEEVKAPGLFKKALGFLEAVAILGLDFILLLVILIVLSLLILIADAMIHPVQNFQILWDLFGGSLDSIRPTK